MSVSEPDGIVVHQGEVWITEENADMIDEISTTNFLVRVAFPAHSGP